MNFTHTLNRRHNQYFVSLVLLICILTLSNVVKADRFDRFMRLPVPDDPNVAQEIKDKLTDLNDIMAEFRRVFMSGRSIYLLQDIALENCHTRARLLAHFIERAGVRVVGYLRVGTPRNPAWCYHVAPVLRDRTSGSIIVADSIDGYLPIREWAEIQLDEGDSDQVFQFVAREGSPAIDPCPVGVSLEAHLTTQLTQSLIEAETSIHNYDTLHYNARPNEPMDSIELLRALYTAIAVREELRNRQDNPDYMVQDQTDAENFNSVRSLREAIGNLSQEALLFYDNYLISYNLRTHRELEMRAASAQSCHNWSSSASR